MEVRTRSGSIKRRSVEISSEIGLPNKRKEFLPREEDLPEKDLPDFRAKLRSWYLRRLGKEVIDGQELKAIDKLVFTYNAELYQSIVRHAIDGIPVRTSHYRKYISILQRWRRKV